MICSKMPDPRKQNAVIEHTQNNISDYVHDYSKEQTSYFSVLNPSIYVLE